jgi:hypothetical protein
MPVVVSEGGGSITTGGGVSAIQPGGTAVVEMPVRPTPTPPKVSLPESGAGVFQRPVTPPPDLTPGAKAGWTTDPNVVVRAVEAAGGIPVPPAQLGPTPLPPGSSMWPWLPTSWRPGREAPIVLPGEDTAPRLAPGQDPTPRLAPAAQSPIARYFPALQEEGSADPRLLPGVSRAPMSERPGPLQDYMELAGGASQMSRLSRRPDRRIQPLHPLQIAEYREHTFADRREDALEGHEIAQNLWLQLHGYTSERGTGMASRWNPTIALPPEVHRAVSAYQAALGLYDRKALKKMGYREMVDLNELALREGLRDSGYPEATIRGVVKQATDEAWEHAIFTSARGKRRK